MGCAIAIVFALRPQCKTIETIGRPNRVETIFASGEELVHVCLVTDIPHKFILWSRKTVMQGKGKLDDSQVGTEMSTML